MNESLYKKTENQERDHPAASCRASGRDNPQKYERDNPTVAQREVRGYIAEITGKKLTDGRQSVSGGDSTYSSAMAEEWGCCTGNETLPQDARKLTNDVPDKDFSDG